MEAYLEKRIYVYRKSYKYFSDVSLVLFISKFCLTSSGLSALAFAPLAALSLSASIVEMIERHLKLNERKEEYRLALKFYQALLTSWKLNQTDKDIYEKEAEFVKTLQFLPREKYLKRTNLNGYKWIDKNSS